MPGCSIPRCACYVAFKTRMFRFPSNPERREVWRKFCERGDWIPRDGSRLCESHFDEDQFERHRQDGWKKLKPNAIPTLFPRPSERKSTRKNTKTPASTKRKKQTLKVQVKKAQASKKSPKHAKKVCKTEPDEPAQLNKRKRRTQAKTVYDSGEYEVDWPKKRRKTSMPPTTAKSAQKSRITDKKVQATTEPRQATNAAGDAGTEKPQTHVQDVPLHMTYLNRAYQQLNTTPKQDHGYAKRTVKKLYTETPPVELVEVCFSNEMDEEEDNEAFSCRNCVKLTVEVAALQLENKELRKELSCLNQAIKIFLNPGQRETLEAVAESFSSKQQMVL